MKAEEFLKSIYGDEIESPLFPTDGILELLRQFGSIKCKEQREICADNVRTYYVVDADKVDEDSILNSPEPEM